MRAYQDMVFSTAARLAGNDGQAEDIAQEVFLRAYEHFGDLRTSPTAGGWLKTVATNLALNYLSRYRKRWRMFSELRPADADEEPSAPELGPPQPDTVIADCGRLDPGSPALAIAARAQVTVLMVRPRVSELSHLALRAGALSRGGARLALLLCFREN